MSKGEGFMKITKRQLKRIIKEYNPRLDPEYDPLNPPDEFEHESQENELDYNSGLEAGFYGWPQDAAGSDSYYAGYERGENDARDPDSEASLEYEEEFGPRREGKIKLTKRQLRRIIKEQLSKSSGGSQDPWSNADGYPDPRAWAGTQNLQFDYDDEGQKLIYLGNEEADTLDFPIDYRTGKKVEWDVQQDYDGEGWTIYTGDYDGD